MKANLETVNGRQIALNLNGPGAEDQIRRVKEAIGRHDAGQFTIAHDDGEITISIPHIVSINVFKGE